MKGPRISIRSIAITGVDAATAARLGPEIERALATELYNAAIGGSRQVGDLRVTAPEGVGAADIAKSVAGAVTKAVR